MSKQEMSVVELRDFLNGGGTVPDHGPPEIGYRDGTVLGDPGKFHRRSEIIDGRFIVRSWRGKAVAEFPLAEISSVVCVSAFLGSWFNESCSAKTWLVDSDGRPLAEVPWGHTVQEQAKEAGMSIRQPQMIVDKAAFNTLRPELQLE